MFLPDFLVHVQNKTDLKVYPFLFLPVFVVEG
jgi:hypothetical protein